MIVSSTGNSSSLSVPHSLNGIVKDLSTLADSKLILETEQAASRDKTTTLEFLEYLAEVDRRRLFAALGFSSLFEYVHRGLGYSEPQTSERVSAMRLIRRVPEIKEALAQEKLTLTSAAKIAAHLSREGAGDELALTLLKKCEGKSTREVERVLVDHVTKMSPRPDRAKAVSREFTQVAFDADQELVALIKRAKELNGDPSYPLNEIFKYALREYVRQKENRRGMNLGPMKSGSEKLSKTQGPNTTTKESDTLRVASSHLQHSASRAPEVKHVPIKRPYLNIHLKRDLFKRAQNKCEFFDPGSGRRCLSPFRLEIDHIKPAALGGGNEMSNLRVVCKTHNLFYAEAVFGKTLMSRFYRH